MTRIRNIVLSIVVFSCCLGASKGQDSTLYFDSYIDIVRTHHPFIYRADILVEMAEANILKARGAFDPKIEAGLDHKNFNETNYYSLFNGGLSLPLWFGSDIKLNFDRNNGSFLDNSDFLPERGLLGPGIDLVLGRGLVSDTRRATLQKAKTLRTNSTLDRRMLINDLLFSASKAYFKFQEASLKESLVEESVQLARVRLLNTAENYIQGYTAAVDTLEAGIAVQIREQALLQVRQERQNRLTELGNYLWLNGSVPVETQEFLKCGEIDFNAMRMLADSLITREPEILASHPKAKQFDNKATILEIDRKLNRENLKPELVLSYSPLIDFQNEIGNGSLFLDDYKLGFSMSYPLFTRKERGELKMTELKMQDLGFEQSAVLQKLRLDAKVKRNTISNLVEQLDRIQLIRENTSRLLDAENLKFSIGESSVFLVNSREQKYIEARRKEIEIQIKVQDAIIEYLYTINKLDLL